MKTTEGMTEEEINNLADEYADKIVASVHCSDTSLDEAWAREWVATIYGWAGLKPPMVEICDSKKDALRRAGLPETDHLESMGMGADSAWTGASMFSEEILGKDLSDIKEWAEWKKFMTIGIYGVILFENVAYLVRRPKAVHVRADGQLHRDGGPAFVWADGTCEYFLNGIRVPEWLAVTDAGKIDPTLALTEKNADVQREIIRKVGADRVLKAGNAEKLDVFNDPRGGMGSVYTLYRMKIGDSIDRKYLVFDDASLKGVSRAKPVHPSFDRAIHARGWIVRVADENKIKEMSDAEIIERLPKVVS